MRAKQPGGSGAEAISALLTREALRELVYSYSFAADTRDAKRLESLFHPDGLVDSGVIRDKPKAFAEQFADWLQQNTISVFHAVSGMVFEIAGERATGEVQVIALCEMKPSHGGAKIITAGRYSDKYMVYEGRWVISERIFKPETSWEVPAAR